MPNNNNEHFQFDANESFLPICELSDENNKKISNLYEFTKSFLAKCTLGQMISRYMVLIATEKKLVVMRPYQIYAVKAIVNCIEQNRGNGYIWHTTGSGKTLTSFKASTLLKDNPNIEKCLFVVDRKDLDKQTRDEFNKFQNQCVEGNTNTETLVQRLLSKDYSDKVIVTTIQKLGIALDENHRRNKTKKIHKKATYKERLEPLRNKKIVIIFDECHRSQFGENHKAIKEFFPGSQLFGFTGTPIFEKNASYRQIDGSQASYKTTKDIFEKQLHTYTITNAIDDKNVLRFRIEYFKPKSQTTGKRDEETKKAIINQILEKHNQATNGRRFNAILATASINDAIQYYKLFQEIQKEKLEKEENYKALRMACVFSPPSEGNSDVKQLQEDLPQEKADNTKNPELKKRALKEIINDYNQQYNVMCSIDQFDAYYQNIQQRIKDQKYSNQDKPAQEKIDIIIVVDMLLTGFDSKYLNTLYIDKNLKHHSLIQAFSRSNRILNETKPFGNIFDFRGQEKEVDEAIALFSGEKGKEAKEIWTVEPAKALVQKFNTAVKNLEKFMQDQDLSCSAGDVKQLKGDRTRANFINTFKEVQRIKNQLNQYTDLKEEEKASIEKSMPEDSMRAFRGVYLETAQDLKAKQDNATQDQSPEVEQLNFEFILFSSAIIDYDYIMDLMASYTQDENRGVSKDEILHLLNAHSNLIEEKEDIKAYVATLEPGQDLEREDIKNQYKKFTAEKFKKEISQLAQRHSLEISDLQSFVDQVLDRMIFDGEKLTDLTLPLDLAFIDRVEEETKLMSALIPLLKQQAKGEEISGLAVYEK